MHDFTILKDIVIVLALALPIIYLFKRIHIPTLVGFLLAGMLIGPHGLNLISEIKEIEIMAEVGVIFLLFTIGLEVSLTQLMKMKSIMIFAGGAQVIFTILISYFIFIVFGVEPNLAILFGMLVSLSSTAIVLKLLADRDELSAPQGRLSIGILIFQDLMIVPMFLVLPMLQPENDLSYDYILGKLGLAFGLLIVILLLAKFLMPKIMYQLAKLRMRDAFVIGILVIILGTAYLTHSLGLSFALGAFIAGLILAESDYHSQILADTLPFKDVFNSIFFVSVGLLLNVSFVYEYPLFILGLTISSILIKAAIIIVIVLALKYPLRIAIITGLGLAQIGEFSIIIAQASNAYNLLSEYHYNIFLATSIFTMVLTPFLFKFSARIGFASQKLPTLKEIKEDKSLSKMSNHVIIAGFGLNGKNLARVLKETGISYIVVELNPDTVQREKANGEHIIYGDVSKAEILKHVKIDTANTLVFSISDPPTTKRSVRIAKQLNPELFVLVRTRYVSEINELKRIGADAVIPEEFETSLELFRKVLMKFHIPMNVIMQQISLLRQESYKMLRDNEMDVTTLTHLDEILAENLTETYYLNDDNPNLDRPLKEIDLRAQTGATVITIIRKGKTIFNPSGDEKLTSHDTLVIMGIHKAIDAAIKLLNGVSDTEDE
jgi:CPA2 family monovalent cation:H+ antiporter-2